MMLEKLPQFGKRLSPDNDRPTLTGPRFFQNIGGHILLDYQPAERSKYIDAFFSNINWDIIEERLGRLAP